MATSYRPKSFGFARIHRGLLRPNSVISQYPKKVSGKTQSFSGLSGYIYIYTILYICIYIYIPHYIYIYRERESVLYHVYGCICIYVYYHLYIYIYMIYHIYIIFIKQQQETNLAPSGRWAAVPCLLGSNPWPRWAKNGFRQGKTADFVAPSCRKMLILWNLMVI